jgi:hypothetical protein
MIEGKGIRRMNGRCRIKMQEKKAEDARGNPARVET